jgi:hypothetical protein
MAEERRPNQAFVEGLSAEESPIHSPAGSVCNLFGHLQTPPSLSRGQNQQQEEERTLDLDADVNYFMELEGEDQQGEDDDEASVEKPIDSAHSSQKNQRKATTIVVSVPLANYHHLQDYQEQQQVLIYFSIYD